MIDKIKSKFDLNTYKAIVGTRTNIHKVSYFFKHDIKDIHLKKILFLDLEFSMNKVIFEIGGFTLNKGILEDLLFEEYSLPESELVWSFEKNAFIKPKFEKHKKIFSEKDSKRLLYLIDSVDYVVVHNYVAEAQCLHKIIKPGKKYELTDLNLFNKDKIICTCFSFKNEFFKKHGLEKFSNSEISNTLGWVIKDKEDHYTVKNESINVKFKVRKPAGVKSELHNSFYDSVITLTNFFSLKRIFSN